MKKGTIHIYVPEKDGSDTGAFGRAFLEAAEGRKVVVIQFIDGKLSVKSEFLKKLEPELKLFSFENIRNGMNYARKVLATEECDLLILTDILEMVDSGRITVDDLRNILNAQGETDIILTGQSPDAEISSFAEKVYRFVC